MHVGTLETKAFRKTPAPFWLVCLSDMVKGRLRQMFFVVVGCWGATEQKTRLSKFEGQASHHPKPGRCAAFLADCWGDWKPRSAWAKATKPGRDNAARA